MQVAAGLGDGSQNKLIFFYLISNFLRMKEPRPVLSREAPEI